MNENYMNHFVFVLLLVTAIITAGCVNGNQNTVGTPTITNGGISHPVQQTTTSPQELSRFPMPKYKVGDVISKEMPYYYQGFMISDYNEKTGKYSRLELGRANCGNGKYGIWWRAGGNNWEDMDASSMEGAYPIYLGHIDDPSKIPSARQINPLQC
jgi:hypothetical protein